MLPVLGLIAKFIIANGTRAATRKYGAKAVQKAAKEIKARQKAIDKNVDKLKQKGDIPFREKTPLQTQKARETRLVTERNKRMQKSSTDDNGKPKPLKFSKGGGVNGRKKMVYGGMNRKKKVYGGSMGSRKKAMHGGPHNNMDRIGMAMGGAMEVQKPN
tara:strand:- start:3406 stop:3882 length:477 start_codon:yes stop_codon:yes gene_type:complete